MNRLKAAGLAAAGALFLAVGVWMLADGETVTGVGTVAFGLMLLVVAPTAREPPLPDEPLRVSTVTRAGRSFHGLVITMSRRRLLLILAGGAAFTVVGVTLILDGALLPGILCTAFFGLLTVVGVITGRGGSGALVFTPDELAVLTGGGASVRWDGVSAVVRYDIRGAPILEVDGDVEHHSALGRMLAQLTRRPGMAIALHAVGVDSGWLEELVRSCVEDPDRRARVATGDVPPFAEDASG